MMLRDIAEEQSGALGKRKGEKNLLRVCRVGPVQMNAAGPRDTLAKEFLLSFALFFSSINENRVCVCFPGLPLGNAFDEFSSCAPGEIIIQLESLSLSLSISFY